MQFTLTKIKRGIANNLTWGFFIKNGRHYPLRLLVLSRAPLGPGVLPIVQISEKSDLEPRIDGELQRLSGGLAEHRNLNASAVAGQEMDGCDDADDENRHCLALEELIKLRFFSYKREKVWCISVVGFFEFGWNILF